MKIITSLCLSLLLFASGSYCAEETFKVAILEFQNKANHIITVNRWTMAEDLAKYLQKKDKRIETVKRKELKKAVDEFAWNGDRLTSSQEEKIENLGVRYLIYGTIARWRIRGPVTDGYQQQAPEATVVFTFDVVDLALGNVIKSITKDGNATGELGRIDVEDPFDTDETKHEDELYDATKIALLKAAAEISEVISSPKTD